MDPELTRVSHVCSDTRIILCQNVDGAAIPLTEKHHAEARVEAARLRRFGMGAGGSIVDAFGESRWMGAVENTRRSVTLRPLSPCEPQID